MLDGFVRVYDGTRYQVLFGLENMFFTIELDILSQNSGVICFFSQLHKNESWFLWFFATRKNTDFA